MGIKPLACMPEPQINERMERLKKDALEIIDRRIPVCEITDPPYTQNTMRDRLDKAMRIAVWKRAGDAGKTLVGVGKLFSIESRKVDGVVRWYVRFDVEKWNAEVSGDD